VSPPINSFSDELRRRRRTAGLSQAVLAERAGLSTEAVSLLERGRRVPRPTTIRLLADALDLPEEDRSQLMDAPTTRLPPQHELPRYDDLLVGRTDEIEQVATLLTTGPGRLLTLTGPGGVGKTRLAVAAATRVAGDFAAGVRWVQAMASDDGQQLTAAVRAALGLGPAEAFLPGVNDVLPDHPMLLVIDRAEPFLPAVVAMVDALLRRTGSLRVLVTSRERLHLPQEATLVVPPLAVDSATLGTDLGLDSAPATRLFVARAALARGPESPPRARLSPRDAAAVTAICRRLDGIPLAIELAAARTTLLSITELATALDTTLRFLYTPHADDEVALRDVMVGETYPQLSRPERQLLARLSVFSHSFDRASMAAVCSEKVSPSDAVDPLSLLVSKSLVLRGADVDGCATYRLLRVVREFAEEQFALDPDYYAVRRRYAHYFRDQAELAAPHLSNGGKARWSRRLDTQSDDLRRAFAWCLRHDSGSALIMVNSLWRWWHLRGRYREGRSLATAALRCSVQARVELRAPALVAAGMLALLQCDYEAAQAYVQEGLDLYSVMSDGAGVRWSLALLGSVALQRGEYTVAGQLHEQALVLARRADDRYAVGAQLIALSEVAWLRGDFRRAESRAHGALETLSGLGDQQGIVLALVALGVTARYSGELTKAQALLSHSLRRSEQIGYREGIAWSLNQLGAVSRMQGDFGSAQVQQAKSLEEHRSLGNRWRLASTLDELAAVAVAQGDSVRATAELGAADQLRREIGTPVPSAEQADRNATVAAARSLFGSDFALRSPEMAGGSSPFSDVAAGRQREVRA
jgi:predicted ATPase/DNA-binding XRE family transcriptional regulator